MALTETKPTKAYDSSGWQVGATVTLALAAIGYCLFAAPPPPTPPLSSTVTVSLANGHGSGIHIGNGWIVTAAHVAKEGDSVVVLTSDGKTRDAVVVWASGSTDIALLQTASDYLATSPLACAPPVLGQPVSAHGSPMEVGQVITYGKIVGEARPMEHWAAVVPVDMTILPGMSGGALISPSGEVVGIVVGIVAYPTLAGATLTGLGVAVPSSVVCGLLGRS